MPFISADRIRFLLQQLRKQLWLKPLVISLLSVLVAFLAKLADGTGLASWTPQVTLESVSRLLSVMSSSMMVIATLAVASMVSAYASASSTATPRAVKLVIADDLSQNALSTFIGAFIFSIVALTAIDNDFYKDAGLFTLLVLTVVVFAIVILTFVRWVDRIARLGRVGTTIDSVEEIAAQALHRRRQVHRWGACRAPLSPARESRCTAMKWVMCNISIWPDCSSVLKNGRYGSVWRFCRALLLPLICRWPLSVALTTDRISSKGKSFAGLLCWVSREPLRMIRALRWWCLPRLPAGRCLRRSTIPAQVSTLLAAW